MLMLLFRIGDSRYALDTMSVVEIIPNVELTTIYGAHPRVTGFLTYHGRVVPVVTLSQLLGGGSKAATLSTRIILIRLDPSEYPAHSEHLSHSEHPKENRGPRLLGLMAEQMTDTLDRTHAISVEDRSTVSASPYLGEILLYQQEIVQCLKTEALLSWEEYGALVSSSVTTSSATTPSATTPSATASSATASSATPQPVAPQAIAPQAVVSQINSQIDKGVPVG